MHDDSKVVVATSRRWERPRIWSFPIPLLEEALAVMYRKKADGWADRRVAPVVDNAGA